MSGDYVRNPDMRLLNVIHELAAHHAQTWCKPSGDKLRELLQRFHGVIMSPHTLWRHIGALVRDGYLIRTCRHKKLPSGSWELHSNLYRLGSRGFDYIGATFRAMKRVIHRARAKIKGFAMPETAQCEVKNNTNHIGRDENRAHAPNSYIEALRALTGRRRKT